MKKYDIISMILLSLLTAIFLTGLAHSIYHNEIVSNPKYIYLENVRVVSGFYKGLDGVVISYNSESKEYEIMLQIECHIITNTGKYINLTGMTRYIKERDLKEKK